MKKIKYMTQSRTGMAGIYKSPYIGIVFEPNIHNPLVYFRKPKWMLQETFDIIVDDILNQIQRLSEESVKALEQSSDELEEKK